MHEHPDDDLSLLFERARRPLEAEPFLTALDARLAGARRGLRTARIVAAVISIALAAVLARLATPLLSRFTILLGTHLEGALPRLGDALASPLGWTLALVLAVVILRRSGVLGR